MERVVLLVRVSTDKQDYERQINELSDYCRKMDWAIEKVFANKVSGAVRIEERVEICELVSFVKNNQICRVVCLEISRVGRNTLEALKVIQILNEHKVSLFVKNYNLETLDADGKVNPIASLICTILLEIASMERLTIKERSFDPQFKKNHYTHSRVRVAYFSLRRNMQYLWTFYDYPETHLPNTNNCLEAVNTDLKTKLRVHNGLSKRNRMIVIDEYFRQKIQLK